MDAPMIFQIGIFNKLVHKKNRNTLLLIRCENTTTRILGLDASGCAGNNSTKSGMQWTPSIWVPSLMAKRCRL